MDRIRARVLRTDPPVTGEGVRVAVLDTGVDPEHPDLVDALVTAEATCFSFDVLDRHGHGTHIAGIIAGSGKLSDGFYRGIAPKVELACYKVGGGRTALGADVAAAVEKALAWDADIINYSGGQAGPNPPPWKWSQKLSLRDRAFQRAAEAGVLCVAAAGNEGPHKGSINRPGALGDVLAVGALDNGNVAHSSSRGPVYVDPTLGRGEVERLDEAVDEPGRLIPPNVVKPDLVASGGRPAEMPPSRKLAPLVPLMGPVSCRSKYTENYLPLDPTDPSFAYTRIFGSSQATAVISGLAALLLEYGRHKKLDWGPNPGEALTAVLKESAALPAEGSDTDYGAGFPTWVAAGKLVEQCAESPVRRDRVFRGVNLKLL